jgi:hypothetical protein
MKCRVVKMRSFGVKLDKYELSRDIGSAMRREELDDLEILDTLENSLNRVVKLAKRTYRSGGDALVEILYEPHILWMREYRFVLTGFERQRDQGRVIEYAQSWLCDIGPEEELTSGAPHSYRGRKTR